MIIDRAQVSPKQSRRDGFSFVAFSESRPARRLDFARYDDPVEIGETIRRDGPQPPSAQAVRPILAAAHAVELTMPA